MSTRSRIGIQNSDGSVDSIYCHSDGYPSWNGEILLKHYTPGEDREKVTALIDLGDISCLGPEIGEKHDFDDRPDGVVNAYGRDRGETGTEFIHSDTVEDFLILADDDYTYLLDENDEWQFRNWKEPLQPLTAAVIAND